MVTPSAARRRDVRATSSRSLLLTLLGEFVLRNDGSAWTWPLVTTLRQLDIEEKAARQAIARTVDEGLLTSVRNGRRTRHALTNKGRRLLDEGTERIYGFLREPDEWDGRWLVLTVSVPEAQRRLRHQLRTRLAWAGLGSPLPGVWVTPHVDKEKEVAAAVAELHVDGFSWIGPSAAVGDITTLVAQAWSLDDVAERYRAFLASFGRAHPATPSQTFLAQIRLVHAWRRFPFLDPALPPSLLPHNWPGGRAAKTFHQQHDRWDDLAQAHWNELGREADERS